eukprot:10188523-Lingulodinium_polyedra.AAC.1
MPPFQRLVSSARNVAQPWPATFERRTLLCPSRVGGGEALCQRRRFVLAAVSAVLARCQISMLVRDHCAACCRSAAPVVPQRGRVLACVCSHVAAFCACCLLHVRGCA